MSQIYSSIKSDITTSMKSGAKVVTGTLRLLVDSIQKKMAAKKVNIELVTDDVVIDCINSAIKQREESIAEFKKGNRSDLVEKEEAEIYILRKYQPAQMSKDEVTQKIKDIIASGAAPAAMGLVMKSVMAELKGKADGKMINEIVRQLLC